MKNPTSTEWTGKTCVRTTLWKRSWKKAATSSTTKESFDCATGECLDPAQVKAGCDEELKYMRKMKVWDRVLRSEVRDKIIGTRWVYTKKPNLVRSRLVAQEFAGSEKGKTCTQEPLPWQQRGTSSRTRYPEEGELLDVGGSWWSAT